MVFLSLILFPFIVFSQKETPAGNTKLLPSKFIEEKEVKNDPSIINNTDLKIYLLFNQNKENLLVGEELFGRPVIYKNKEDLLVIEYQYNTIFLIRPTGVEIKQTQKENNTQEANRLKEIKAKWYTTTLRVEELPNGGLSRIHEDGKVSHKIQFGKLEVNRKREPQCDDTGTNPITIYRNDKKLEFTNIRNLGFFECDVDGKNELFILDFVCCEGSLKIYKIKE